MPSMLSACTSTSKSTLAKLEDGDEIRIAYADEVPFAYSEGDEAVGQSVAVYTEILKELGAEEGQLSWVLTNWDNLTSNLGANHDMVVAGMFVTPGRCESVLFADPDYVMPDAIMKLAENDDGLDDLEAFVDSDARLGVMSGTSEQEYAIGMGVDEERITPLDDLETLIQELRADRIDGIALTEINLRLRAEEDDDLVASDPFIPIVNGEEQLNGGAGVFQTSDADLRDLVNDEIAKLLDDKERWLGLVEEFDFNDDYFPPDEGFTAEELCGDAYQ